MTESLFDRAKAPLANVRWRMVILTLAALTVICTVAFNTSLHEAAKSHLTTLKAKAEPQPYYPSTIASFASGDTEEDVAICLAVKDQFADLPEWLVHHYNHHGVRRFYIMDDGTSPPLSTHNYSAFIDERAITHRYYLPNLRSQYPQLTMYDECMKLFGHRHKWIGFLDADEFLEMKAPYTLHGMLREWEANSTVGAFAINWKMHGSSGLLTRPLEGVRKSFTKCLVDDDVVHDGGMTATSNQHIKVFVKTEAYCNPNSPHKMDLKEGYKTLGENGDEVTGHAWRVPGTKEKAALHHYSLKSKEEFEEKMHRGNAMNDPKKESFWEVEEAMEQLDCFEMAEYEP